MQTYILLLCTLAFMCHQSSPAQSLANLKHHNTNIGLKHVADSYFLESSELTDTSIIFLPDNSGMFHLHPPWRWKKTISYILLGIGTVYYFYDGLKYNSLGDLQYKATTLIIAGSILETYALVEARTYKDNHTSCNDISPDDCWQIYH